MKQTGISKNGVLALKALRSAVKKAIARQWAAGLPIYIVENGRIVRKWPTGDSCSIVAKPAIQSIPQRRAQKSPST